MPQKHGVLYPKNLSPRFARHFFIEIYQPYTSGLILIQGENSQMSREQVDTKIHLGSTKNYFRERQENNSGSREKKVKFQREPGAGDPPLWGLSSYWKGS